MSFPQEVRQLALRLIELLEREQIDYMMMGGLAVPVWGIPRTTYDIDLTLSVDQAGFKRFLAAVRADGFEIDPPFESGYRDLLHGMEKIRIEWWSPAGRRVEVDVFLVTTPYQQAAFPRRRRVKIDGRQMWVIDAMDLVLHKLVAGRPKDIADISNILAIQGLCDETYVREWAGRLGVSDRLEAALAS